MKVSVITVCYNAEKVLVPTMKSVLSQEYSDFEYIIVDGASTDGSVMLIKEYADARTKWISEPDAGIYNAMNKAVGMAEGDYCIFMNAGDLFANPLVLKQVSLFLDDDFDVLTGCEISIINGKPLDYVRPIKKVTKDHFFVTSISHQSSFIKRTVLLEHPYDENLRLVSDWKFWLQTIVFGGYSYRPIDVDVSLFNHDGVTYSSGNAGRMERSRVIQELFPEEDIRRLSKKYTGTIPHIRRKIINKLHRIIHRDVVRRKMKTAFAYVQVLGLMGIPVALIKILKLGGGNLLTQRIISRYIKIHYGKFVSNDNLVEEKHLKSGKFPVWVCWWQGEEYMPLVPKVCIKKLRENIREDYELIVITRRNYQDYMRIPDYVLEKVNNGNYTITLFSDILRFGLLSRYGGIWVDATCYTGSKIPDLTTLGFYSNKQLKKDDYTFVSRYRWASYLIGGKKRLIFSNMYSLFLEYAKIEKYIVDYFLVDYFMDLIYKESHECRNAIDGLDIINADILKLQGILNEEYDIDKMPLCVFNKLSWKNEYKLYKGEKKTFWGVIISNIEL